MIGFEVADKHFNYRAAGVALYKHYILLHQCKRDPFGSLPGGRPDWLEPSQTTLQGEMQEELGVKMSIDRLVWVVENFYNYDARDVHELAFYSQRSFSATSWCLDTEQVFKGNEEGFDLTFWFPLDKLENVIIYPSFLKDGLRHLPETVTQLVHYDA